jgi:hypothetical protein
MVVLLSVFGGDVSGENFFEKKFSPSPFQKLYKNGEIDL